MREHEGVDVGRLVDGQRIRSLNLVILTLALLAVVIDGYDIFVPGFLAPELIKAWHFPPQELGGMFALGMLGIITGAVLFGHFGDRMGRKRAIVWSSLLYGVLSIASIWSQNLTQFTILRFFIGLGIGGAIPNAIALVCELTPRRMRSNFLLLMMVGAPIGQLLPGIATLTLVPTHGWQVLLVIGGVGPILIAALMQLSMPESIKYLALHPTRQGELVQLARRLRPDMVIADGTRFHISEPSMPSSWSPASLFANGLGAITLLIWLCLGAGLLGVYFIASWLPAVLHGAGLSMQAAAGRLAFFALGGILGGVLMTPLVRRFGYLAIIGVFVVSVPLVASIGISGLGLPIISALTAAAGFCVIAIINGVECVMGQVYPTAIRAKGSGWGLAVGRLGAMVGPLIGSVLIGMQLSNFQLFLAPALCLFVGAIGSIGLAILGQRRFKGRNFSDTEYDGAVELLDVAAAEGKSLI